jgi:hypothetical protein
MQLFPIFIELMNQGLLIDVRLGDSNKDGLGHAWRRGACPYRLATNACMPFCILHHVSEGRTCSLRTQGTKTIEGILALQIRATGMATWNHLLLGDGRSHHPSYQHPSTRRLASSICQLLASSDEN